MSKGFSFAKKISSMNNMRFINQRFSLPKVPPQYLLAFFLFAAALPACRVKEGCAASQKGYTNNMERSKKHGTTSLFPKSGTRKLKSKK